MVGRSNLFGKPMAQLLLGANATVTICHSRTRDLRRGLPPRRRADRRRRARRGWSGADWVKPGAVVIDVGHEPHRRAASSATSTSTPSPRSPARSRRCPGGVGPMTIAMPAAQHAAGGAHGARAGSSRAACSSTACARGVLAGLGAVALLVAAVPRLGAPEATLLRQLGARSPSCGAGRPARRRVRGRTRRLAGRPRLADRRRAAASVIAALTLVVLTVTPEPRRPGRRLGRDHDRASASSRRSSCSSADARAARPRRRAARPLVGVLAPAWLGLLRSRRSSPPAAGSRSRDERTDAPVSAAAGPPAAARRRSHAPTA